MAQKVEVIGTDTVMGINLATSTVMAAEAIIVVSDIYREDLLPQGGYGPFNTPAHRFPYFIYHSLISRSGLCGFCEKSTLEACGYFHGFIDWHNHILPGVDDGVQTIDEALQILAEYERLRIKEVWLTPHIMEDIPNTTKHLQERLTSCNLHTVAT